MCRLRADHDAIRRRLAGRGGPAAPLEQVLRDADALDAAAFADLCVDTTGRSVAEVVARVRDHLDDWPPPAAHRPSAAAEPEAPAATAADGPVLWLCGPRGVGKSTIGFALYLRVLRETGTTAAYLDLDQLGRCHPAPADDPGNHRLKARNLAAVWRTYRAAGARCLTVVGPVEDDRALAPYTDALPGADLTVCRLHAGPEELTRRVLTCGAGGSWAEPGDPLRGLSAPRLHEVADRAVAQAAALERAGFGDLRVDTDGRDVDESVEEIRRRTGWPVPHDPDPSRESGWPSAGGG